MEHGKNAVMIYSGSQALRLSYSKLYPRPWSGSHLRASREQPYPLRVGPRAMSEAKPEMSAAAKRAAARRARILAKGSSRMSYVTGDRHGASAASPSRAAPRTPPPARSDPTHRPAPAQRRPR